MQRSRGENHAVGGREPAKNHVTLLRGLREYAGMLPFDAEIAVRHLAKSDATLARLMKQVGPLQLAPEKMQSSFEALVRSIVYQQLTGKAAATILARVRALYDSPRVLDPAAVLATPIAQLRGAGLSAAKAAALLDLAAKTLDGTVPTMARLRKLSDEDIVQRLIAVRGIGRWSVEMLLIFRLGRPDVLPVNDYGVRKGFAKLYEHAELPTPKSLEKFGERWRPYRTVAAWYLWRALDT